MRWSTILRSTTPPPGRSPSPARFSNATPRPLADLVAALPMWGGRYEIVVTGDRPDLLGEIRRRWLPAAVTAWGQPDGGPLFAGRPPEPGRAYVCQARSCRMPAADATTLAAQLEALVA